VSFVEVLSIIVACAALLVALIAVVRGKGAENAAEEARARADEALAHSNAAAEAASSAVATAADALQRAATAAQSASAAMKTAGDANASAHAAENLAERAQAQATQAVERAAAATEEAALAGWRVSEVAPAASAPDGEVRWECERLRGADWVARNVGSVIAHAALVSDASRPPKYVRPDEVIPRDVQPGDHLPFRASSDSAVRSPRIRLTWSDDEGTAQAHELTLVMN
jgi:hypothetical protein